MNLIALSAPFKAEEIEWRVGSSGTSNGKIWAKVLAYVTARSVQQRLDDVCGPGGWKNEYREYSAGEKKGVLCGISIKVGDEWVTKWDGADNTDIEPVKGGLSDSMKRAGCQWGMGRYLYELEEAFAEVSTERKQGWKWGQTKEKAQFYWKPPALPQWALPDSEKKNAERHDDSEGQQEEAEHVQEKPAAKNTPPQPGSKEELDLLHKSCAVQAKKLMLGPDHSSVGMVIDSWEDLAGANGNMNLFIAKLPQRLRAPAVSYFKFLYYQMLIMAEGPGDGQQDLRNTIMADKALADKAKKILCDQSEESQ